MLLPDSMDHHQSSQLSMVCSTDNGFEEVCRICFCKGQSDTPLIFPCYCSGSLCYAHNACLQQWIKTSNIQCCEICKFQFIICTKIKPFRKVLKILLLLKHIHLSTFKYYVLHVLNDFL